MVADEGQGVVRRELPGGLSPAAVLALLRHDPHPFALTGRWAGCAAVLGSRPVSVAAAPGDLDRILGGRFGPADGPAGGPAHFAGGWVGYLGYGLAGRLHALPPAPGGPRQLPDFW